MENISILAQEFNIQLKILFLKFVSKWKVNAKDFVIFENDRMGKL